MAVKVIITRAEPGQVQTARTIARHSLVPIAAPMLHLYPRDVSVPDLADYGAVLFTSANGVRFLAQRLGASLADTGLTAFCVGPATLAAARQVGFSNCEHADGNAQDLADLVQASRTPEDGKLLHIANAAAAGDLAKTLRIAGFSVDFLALYAADPARETIPDVIESLASTEPVIVLVHSAKAAEAFKRLYTLPADNPHILLAVSTKAAAPLRDFGFADVQIAAQPNERALMTRLLVTCTTL